MTRTQDPNDIPVAELNRLKAEDTRNFRNVKLQSFQANPATVAPFETATLSWEVSMPEVLALKLKSPGGERIVDPAGSREVGAFATTKYTLVAVGEVLTKDIGSLTLTFDGGSIVTVTQVVPLVEAFIKPLIKDLFPADQIALRDESVKVVSIDLSGIKITLPMVIYVNNWRNADLDISLLFKTRAKHDGARSSVEVTMDAHKTFVDVSWSFPEHLLSYYLLTGSSTLVQYVSQLLFKGFINGPLKAVQSYYCENSPQFKGSSYGSGTIFSTSIISVTANVDVFY